MPDAKAAGLRARPPAGRTKDHVYIGAAGYLFTSAHVSTPPTRRHPAVLLLTAPGRPCELTVGTRRWRSCAIAVAPCVRRALHAVDVDLVSVHVNPNHRAYRVFASLPPPGVLALDRDAFAACDADLDAAYRGRLGAQAAQRLFERLVEIAVRQLPATEPPDPRAATILAILEHHPDCTLAQLADAIGLSYHRMSHLFSAALGLSFRSYRHWWKTRQAGLLFASQRSLTEIAHATGFTDSAHLSRTWQQRYGLRPSYLRSGNCVQVLLREGRDHPRTGETR